MLLFTETEKAWTRMFLFSAAIAVVLYAASQRGAVAMVESRISSGIQSLTIEIPGPWLRNHQPTTGYSIAGSATPKSGEPRGK